MQGGLATAVDGYGSCRSFLSGIDADAGDAAAASSEAEESSGLVKAAGEVAEPVSPASRPPSRRW